jgi:hypothetical protein
MVVEALETTIKKITYNRALRESQDTESLIKNNLTPYACKNLRLRSNRN